MRYLKVRLSPVSADEPKRSTLCCRSISRGNRSPPRSSCPHDLCGPSRVRHLRGNCCIPPGPRRSPPADYTCPTRRSVLELPPYELGFPYGRWSLSKLRSYLIKYKIVSNSREHLRRCSKKGLRLRRVKRKLLSQDPQRRAILRCLRVIWRHRPKQGILLFFDVKVIAVKAYGGRRYTAAKQLVLAQQQRPEGSFTFFSSMKSQWANPGVYAR